MCEADDFPSGKSNKAALYGAHDVRKRQIINTWRRSVAHKEYDNRENSNVVERARDLRDGRNSDD